eukprot:352094-Chlamydomonas_euryale.AAC.2
MAYHAPATRGRMAYHAPATRGRRPLCLHISRHADAISTLGQHKTPFVYRTRSLGSRAPHFYTASTTVSLSWPQSPPYRLPTTVHAPHLSAPQVRQPRVLHQEHGASLQVHDAGGGPAARAAGRCREGGRHRPGPASGHPQRPREAEAAARAAQTGAFGARGTEAQGAG